MLLNCGVGEDSWESLGLQGDQPVHTKGDQSWVFIGRTDVEAETSVFWPPDTKSWLIWKDPDAGKGKEGGEGDDRRWDGLMASPTQWTWVWANSWWWTRRPGVLWLTGSQKVGYNERLNWMHIILTVQHCPAFWKGLWQNDLDCPLFFKKLPYSKWRTSFSN